MGNSSNPQDIFEVDEEDRVGEAMDETLAGLLIIVKRKRQRVQLDTPDGILDFLPELASEPVSLFLVEEDTLVQVPLGFRVEEDRLHG